MWPLYYQPWENGDEMACIHSLILHYSSGRERADFSITLSEGSLTAQTLCSAGEEGIE